MKVEGPIEQIN